MHVRLFQKLVIVFFVSKIFQFKLNNILFPPTFVSYKKIKKTTESLVISRKNQDHCLELIAEYVFLEKKVRKDFSNNIYLTLLQEFQLVVVLGEYFSRPGPDATRNAVFLSLFGGSAITFSRSRVLVKLISTAVSGSIESVIIILINR